MKHLFSVHSPITFLAAHAVIEHLQLKVDDVLIMSNRYKVPLDKYQVFPFLSSIHKQWWQKLMYLNAPLNEDHYLDKLLQGDDFIAYIDLMSFNQVSFITNSACKGFHFIEEGNSSYRTGDDFSSLTWKWYKDDSNTFRIKGIKQRFAQVISAIKWASRGYNHRFLSVPYSYNNFAFFEGVKFFSFSDLAYPDIPVSKKVKLSLGTHTKDIAKLAANISLDDAIIWVDGDNSRFTKLSLKVYHDAIDEAIDRRKTELSKHQVYLKLRPGIDNYSENYLYSTLEAKGFSPQVLPNDLVLEAVFVNSSNCIVIGNLSSALFYAKIFGHRAYSIYHLYTKKVTTIFDKMPGYWSMVENI